MIKGKNYNPPTQYLFLDEIEIGNRIQKQITKFGLTDKDIKIPTN